MTYVRPAILLSMVLAVGCSQKGPSGAKAGRTLLNVSYDPTRELYQAINEAFGKKWQAERGERLTINQSHGGSGKQARAVIDGLEADVVTLALGYDVDAIAARGLIAPDWATRLPHDSAPFSSTIVLVVRKGNPKGIKDFGDLVKPGVQVITPNPKTGGGARWNYLAAYGWALETFHHDEAKAREYLTQLYRNVPVLDSGARGATTTFGQRGLGDVLIAWENEAYLLRKELKDEVELVYPSLSIAAEMPVAWVDKYVQKHGTAELAKAYLEFLYTPEAQELAAQRYYRPSLESAAQEAGVTFPAVRRFTVGEMFGGWQKAHAAHFADGALFDQIYQRK